MSDCGFRGRTRKKATGSHSRMDIIGRIVMMCIQLIANIVVHGGRPIPGFVGRDEPLVKRPVEDRLVVAERSQKSFPRAPRLWARSLLVE